MSFDCFLYLFSAQPKGRVKFVALTQKVFIIFVLIYKNLFSPILKLSIKKQPITIRVRLFQLGINMN